MEITVPRLRETRASLRIALLDVTRAQKPRGYERALSLWLQRFASLHIPDHLGLAHKRGLLGLVERHGVHVKQIGYLFLLPPSSPKVLCARTWIIVESRRWS